MVHLAGRAPSLVDSLRIKSLRIPQGPEHPRGAARAWDIGHDESVTLYLPSQDEIVSLAHRAELRNPNPNARREILRKAEQPADDWDARTVLTVPGVVWSVSSDTCATGRLSAPENIAYDHHFREFVFRQPRAEAELAAIMSADSEEVFSCYRFDGLARWTTVSFLSWLEDMDVVVGYVRHTLEAQPEHEVADGLRTFEAYLTSHEFKDYLRDFENYLRDREQRRSGDGQLYG